MKNDVTLTGIEFARLKVLMESLVAAYLAQEREACAVLAEREFDHGSNGKGIAMAIRERAWRTA